MAIIVCDDKCPRCNTNYVKDLCCNGDYYLTVSGYVRMRFCPNCGIMRPELAGRDPDYIGKNKKKVFGVMVATEFHLGYKETKEDALSIDTNNKQEFIKLFSQNIAQKIDVPITQVSSCFY